MKRKIIATHDEHKTFPFIFLHLYNLYAEHDSFKESIIDQPSVRFIYDKFSVSSEALSRGVYDTQRIGRKDFMPSPVLDMLS